MRFFGLDGEMTGNDLAGGDRLIQIGVATHTDNDGNVVATPELFCAMLNPGPHTWSIRAQAVHGFTPEQVAAASPAADVDAELEAWLLAHGLTAGQREGYVIGFNVGSFDLPFLQVSLPRTFALLSYRSVDLNALCLTLDGIPIDGPGTAPTSWSGWKRLAKTYAERVIAAHGTAYGAGNVEHDAGYDALMAVHAWRYLRSAMAGELLAMPQTAVPMGEGQRLVLDLLAAHGKAGAATLTGFDEETLLVWSKGGRISDPISLDVLRKALTGR